MGRLWMSGVGFVGGNRAIPGQESRGKSGVCLRSLGEAKNDVMKNLHCEA